MTTPLRDPRPTTAASSTTARYLVTDTVGFIRRLPHQLVEGFAATLEETLLADLVLHVADASLSDDRLEETIAAVDSVLAGIGADELPVELVLNKVDLVDPLRRRRLANRFPGALQISARGGEGLPELRARIAERFADRLLPGRLLCLTTTARLKGSRPGAPIGERIDRRTESRARAPARAGAVALRAHLIGDADATARGPTGVIELPVVRLREDARLQSASTRATQVSTSTVRAAGARPARGRSCPRASPCIQRLRGLRAAALGARRTPRVPWSTPG